MESRTFRNPAVEHAADQPRQVSVLPDELSNKIAAGEVVERPASVVKELVENSLDAGATRIAVDIDSGGRERVRVTDDGCGMAREDVLRAVERHATSKISGPEDLDQIGTLGFRGEALPSIGAVSKFDIKTKPHGDLEGTRVFVEGGELKEVEDVGMKAGTAATVDDLFFNTPARRKFMKSASAESRQITEMIIRMGLSRPDVRFKYSRDGNVQMDMPVVEDLKDRVLECMGRDVYESLYPTYEYPAISGVVARGCFSEPSHSQRTSKNIYTFVNGRYVDDATIRAAINKAYGTLLDGGRYPSVILFIEVPFDLLDVNVHPMKTEVRFKDTQPVFRAVYHAIGDALAESPWVEDEEARVFEMSDDEEGLDGAEVGGAADQVSPANANFEPLNARDQRRSKQGDGAVETGEDEVASPFYERPGDEDRQTGFSASEAAPLRQPPTVDVGQSGTSPPDENDEGTEGGTYFSTLRVLGQFKRAYIVCEDKNGLVVIDQHAAHERIGFERLRRQYHEADNETQSLLFGQRIELDAVRSDCLDEHLDFFEGAGFEIEHFGGQSYAIKSVPAMLEEFDVERIVKDALDELGQLGDSERLEEAVDSVLSRMACHSVVRGPTDLTRQECESLLEQMDQIDFRANCPHGRPVYYRIPLEELEKSFDRK